MRGACLQCVPAMHVLSLLVLCLLIGGADRNLSTEPADSGAARFLQVLVIDDFRTMYQEVPPLHAAAGSVPFMGV